MGAAGLFALRVHTPGSSRRSLALTSLAILLACAAVGLASFDSLPVTSVLTPMGIATILVVALALASRQRFVLARENTAERETAPARSIDPSRPQAAFLRDLAILCIVLFSTRNELVSFRDAAEALLPLAPLLALGAGLLLAPDELPLGVSAPARPEPRAAG